MYLHEQSLQYNVILNSGAGDEKIPTKNVGINSKFRAKALIPIQLWDNAVQHNFWFEGAKETTQF